MTLASRFVISLLLLSFSSFGIAQTCLAEWQQCYVNPTQTACGYNANTGLGCCSPQCCSGLVCGGTSSDNVWWAACHPPSAVSAGNFNASFCNPGTTTAPATTAAPTTTKAPTTAAPTTAAPTTTKAPTTAAPTTAAPTTAAPTTAAPTTTKAPTTTAASTTTKAPTTTTAPTTTKAATTTAAPTPTTACTIPIGSQCWGLVGSGSQCSSTGCCAGCCASGQCGGDPSYDNAYWVGCRAAGTSGGPVQSSCTGSPATTTTTAVPGPTPAPSPPKLYCPSANDLVVAYGSPTIVNQGWTIVGGGGVASKSSYNLNGGWVSYTVNWNGVPTGVNANIYSIAPNFNGASSFTNSLYCDGQPATSTKPWCVESDWIETNGNCNGQSTLHTYNVADNSGGCGGWGCLAGYGYSGVTSFTMNVSYDSTGHWNVLWNGNNIGSLSPTPGTTDWTNLYNSHKNLGAVIYSSQWTGWVPSYGSCSTSGGNLAAATMSISNLKIYGSVVQGPTPTLC